MKQNVYFVSGIDTDAGKVTRPATWHANGIKTAKEPLRRSLSKQEMWGIPKI